MWKRASGNGGQLQLQLYRISSREQPTGDDPLGSGFGMELIPPPVKNKLSRNLYKSLGLGYFG
jgi:hypothetical protein